MQVVEVSTGKKYPIDVLPIESHDFRILPKARYFFDWKQEINQEVYKLVRQGKNEILGLVSIERIPEEWRIHIRLLTVSKENVGSSKRYDQVAGNLIAFVARIAVAEFGDLACVSLRPKTAIARHYIETYNINSTGMTLSLEVPEILNLINQYHHDEEK